MRITLNKIKKLVSGRYYGDTALLDKTIKNISINSNDIKNNDLFLGIKGEKFDGVNFAEIAIKKGALAAILIFLGFWLLLIKLLHQLLPQRMCVTLCWHIANHLHNKNRYRVL